MTFHFYRHQLLLGNKLRLIVRHFTHSFGSIPVPDHWPLTALNGPSIPPSPIVPDPFHWWFRTSAWLERPIHKRRALFRPSFPKPCSTLRDANCFAPIYNQKWRFPAKRGGLAISGHSWNFWIFKRFWN